MSDTPDELILDPLTLARIQYHVLCEERAALIAANKDLAAQIAHLQHQVVAGKRNLDAPVNGFYTMGHFLVRLHAARGMSYRWRASYIEASKRHNCLPVKSDMIRQWQLTDRVPAWAVEQIPFLVFPAQRSHKRAKWSPLNREFLIALHRADPACSNADLAIACSKKFNRPISEDSIKGALDRARRKGLLPQYRRDRDESNCQATTPIVEPGWADPDL